MLGEECFYINNHMTARLEHSIKYIDTLEEFEEAFPPEFLNDDAHVGNYLGDLLRKYDKKASAVSEAAGLATSYVGSIVKEKKRNPSRDALISICLAIGTDLEEVQYLLKYAGQAPLYVRRRRDVIIWFGFKKHMTLDEVDENLGKRGYTTLVKDQKCQNLKRAPLADS